MTTPDFTPVSVSTDTPDFTPVSTIEFTLYGDVYYGVPELTLEDSFSYEGLLGQLNDTNASTEARVEVMKTVIRTLLVPDSAERLIAGTKDRHKPIGTPTLLKIFNYIMTEYGGRPTTPGADSSTGSDSPAPGTSSTANTSHEESTP